MHSSSDPNWINTFDFNKFIPGASPKSQVPRKKLQNQKVKILRQGVVSKEYQNKISVVMGDVTEEESMASVCSANPFLDISGGLVHQIVHKGGVCIQEECEDIIDVRKIIPFGQVEVTYGGRLGCKYIIHVVGPNMNEPGQMGINKFKLMDYSINNILM